MKEHPWIRSTLNGLYFRDLNPFTDHRGQFIKLWDINDEEHHWQEDDISISHKNVLRGFHLDTVATKLICPIVGKVFITFIDKEFKHESFFCTENSRYQFLVYPNIGIAHLILSDIGGLHYKQNSLYDINNQKTISWKHPRIGVSWPISEDKIVISKRDSQC